VLLRPRVLGRRLAVPLLRSRRKFGSSSKFETLPLLVVLSLVIRLFMARPAAVAAEAGIVVPGGLTPSYSCLRITAIGRKRSDASVEANRPAVAGGAICLSERACFLCTGCGVVCTR
jgi:hypothetical protein